MGTAAAPPDRRRGKPRGAPRTEAEDRRAADRRRGPPRRRRRQTERRAGARTAADGRGGQRPARDRCPRRYDKHKLEKDNNFKEVLRSLDFQDSEITSKLEQFEDKVAQSAERKPIDSAPFPSVFCELARNSGWSQ